MSDLKDQQIDQLIRGHLSSELDRHVGAASRRFAEAIADERKQRAAMPLVENPRRAKPASGPKFGSFWSIGLVGTALAATMTIVAMRHSLRTKPFDHRSGGGMVQANPDNEIIKPVMYPGEAKVDQRMVDQGIVRMPDGSAARKLLRTTTARGTWKDPKTKKTYEYIEPQQETVYVGLKQY